MPEFYKCFVDDSCSLMPSTDAATDFLVTLNELHPSIRFTMEIAVDGKLPFLEMLLRKSGTVLTTEVYRKPTDSGLLLHFRSHIDNRYKDGLVRTMIDRAAKLSPTKQAFVQECDELRSTFQALQYPDSKFENIMKRFENGYLLCNQPNCKSPSESENQVFRILLPYKDQKSADTVRRQLLQLSAKIHQYIQPVFTSKKIGDSLGVRESKPAIVNQQCVVYHFKCGYSVMRTMCQRIEEHRRASSSIAKHLTTVHRDDVELSNLNFEILRKCRNKFECLLFEMFYIREIKPSLNVQSDSISAKLFV